MPIQGATLRIIIAIIVAILLFFVIRKYWSQISKLFQKSDIDFEEGEGLIIPEKPADIVAKYGADADFKSQQELKQLATDLYSDIYDTPYSGHIHSLYSSATHLTDNELRFLAKYYRKSLTHGTYLFTDVDNEGFVPWTNVDTLLMAHLSKVGEKG